MKIQCLPTWDLCKPKRVILPWAKAGDPTAAIFLAPGGLPGVPVNNLDVVIKENKIILRETSKVLYSK